MTLRLRLFLLLAALVALLVTGQNLLVRSLAERLDRDVAVVAAHVGEEILAGFEFRTGEEEPATRAGERRVLVITRGGAPGEGATSPAEGGSKATDAPALRWQVDREWTREGPDGESAVRRERRVLVEPSGGDGVLLLRGPALARPIPVPRTPVASTLDRFGSQLAAGSLALLALGLVAAAAVAHRATRPLAGLAAAARRLGAGELGVAVPVERRDEIGEALTAFNAMSLRLAALDRENRRLAEAEQLSELGEVARGLAHTLRNPLNALGLSLDELAEGSDPARAAALAEASRRQIRRMDGALRSFLALASASEAAPATVDLAAVAREVALEALQDAGGRVRVVVEAAAPVPLAGVEAELKAICQALVVNACEASPDAGEVRLAVEPLAGEPGGARLVVEDSGPGLAPEVRERLFAPHVTTKPHGSGMGLFLARRLAAGRYGGEVALAGRAEGGTRATVTLGGRAVAGA